MSPHLLLDHPISFTRRIRRLYLTLGDRAELPAEGCPFWHRATAPRPRGSEKGKR
jgi:hypothetical protein